jgi:hypothetical protein
MLKSPSDKPLRARAEKYPPAPKINIASGAPEGFDLEQS